MEDVRAKGIPQIHLIPFDLGISFFDVLSLDNSKNILFAKKFCECIELKSREYGWRVEKLFNIIKSDFCSDKKASISINFLTSFISDSICCVYLDKNLICHILANGVCFFYFFDLNCSILENENCNIFKYNKIMVANFQKKLTQASILKQITANSVCSKVNSLMKTFRMLCWDIIANGIKNKEIEYVRQFSSTIKYKAEGLSYVLSIYLFNKYDLDEKEMKILLLPSIPKKILDNMYWDEIEKELRLQEFNDEKIPYVKYDSSKIYASWSAVAVEGKCIDYKTYIDVFNDECLSMLLRVETYVQSRWFIADNSMDNINNKNSLNTLEKMQRIASLMEFYQAELDNEISANMGTIYKSTLKLIIETSSIKQLYKSVLTQIKTQIRIKEAYYQDRKRKNSMIVDLFLAIFTASSLYKTFVDIAIVDFDICNIILFLTMLIVACGTIIFNYFNGR